MKNMKTTTNKKHYLLVDGDGLLHQSFHKFQNLKTSDGISTGAIFGFFKSLKMYLYRFNPDDVYIVFDNGHSKYREKLLGTYKEHRKRIDIDYESLQSQKKEIRKMLKILNIKYIFDKKRECNYEGDDFIAHLVLKHLPRKQKITIVTADKDFNQLLRGQSIKIYNPRKDQLVYESNCKVIYGYKASETVDYLSLVGDTSDDIPGYQGIGEKRATKFLETYGSIEKYLAQEQCLPDDPCHIKMKEVWKRNQQLIDLKWFCNKYPLKEIPLVEYSKGLKLRALKKFANTYQLGSFENDLFIREFQKQFNRTYGQ